MMFLDTFKKIGLTKEMIESNVEPLIGFDGHSSALVGSVVLLVNAAKKLLHIQFTTMNAIFAYNAILGRS